METRSLFKTAMEYRSKVVTEDTVPIYERLDDIIAATLCPDDFRTLLCYDRKCQQCGVNKLALLPEETYTSETAPDVS